MKKKKKKEHTCKGNKYNPDLHTVQKPIQQVSQRVYQLRIYFITLFFFHILGLQHVLSLYSKASTYCTLTKKKKKMEPLN